MTKREERRARVLNEVLAGRCPLPEAAGLMEVGERQAWRLLRAYRQEGPAGLVHGNRGTAPANRLPTELREEVRRLASQRYAGVNVCHLVELLAEHEGIVVSRPSAQRILAEAGLRPRERRRPRHRSRRDRFPKEGMLLQVDGSHHAWLQDRGPQLVLLGAIDDATGAIAGARFHPTEQAAGYFLLMRDVARNHGLPVAIYSDKHSIFRSTKPETIAEQLSGRREPTQFGRAMEELGISIVFAHSPQAKGRVERLWGTLQGRLVSELALANVSTLEDANRYLKRFIPRFNARFGVPAAEAGSSYRSSPSVAELDAILCFKHERVVSRDNTVRFFPAPGEPLCFQLLAQPDRRTFAGSRVEIRRAPDGRVSLHQNGRQLAARPLSLRQRVTPPKPRTTPARRPPPPITVPPPDHPWRKQLKLTKSLNS